VNNIYNISICSFGNVLSGGEKFTYEVIPRWTKKYPTINYFCYNTMAENWRKNNDIQKRARAQQMGRNLKKKTSLQPI